MNREASNPVDRKEFWEAVNKERIFRRGQEKGSYTGKKKKVNWLLQDYFPLGNGKEITQLLIALIGWVLTDWFKIPFLKQLKL